MNSFKKAAIESVDSMAELYKEIADKIWDNPELSLKEYKAAELYCKVLKDHGFAVTEKLCGIDTAFCGSFGSGKPVIGILGEYDALSGLSQKSGVTEKKPLVHDGSGHGCGKTSIAYKGILCAGKVLAATAIDLMENDELLQEAKAEFEKRSAGGYVCPIEAGAKPIAL